MAEVLTREELYELAWSTPMRTLAARFSMSDVALRKRCQKAAIPLPQVGYWAKRAAGKKVVQPKLPTRPPGMSLHVDFNHRYAYRSIPDEELLGPVPDPPVFDEPLEAIRERYAVRIGKVRVPRELSAAHPAIRKALAEDDQRREAQKSRSYVSIFDRPRFDSPFEHRRLRLLNALALAVTRVGGKVDLRGRKLRDITVTIYDSVLNLGLDSERDLKQGHDEYSSTDTPPRTPLKLVVVKYAGSYDVEAAWQDSDGAKLETQLGDIAAALFSHAEADYRALCQWRHQSRVEAKARLIEKIRAAREKAERDERERQQRQNQAQIKQLLDDAEAFRKARVIRSYVADVIATSTANDPRIAEWSKWALAVADRLDPVVNGTCTLARESGDAEGGRSS